MLSIFDFIDSIETNCQALFDICPVGFKATCIACLTLLTIVAVKRAVI